MDEAITQFTCRAMMESLTVRLFGADFRGNIIRRAVFRGLGVSYGSLDCRELLGRIRKPYIYEAVRVTGRWEHRLLRMAGLIALLGLLLYLGDWGVLELRAQRGTAYRVVEVTQFLATKLKGQKVEYDMMGTFEETCSRSAFPQNGNPPCWWLERHKSQWE